MAWGRMDDGFDDHPKVVALLDEDDLTMAGVAIGLWTLCWTWAHRNTRKRGKTPGLIPPGLPRRFFGQAGKDAVKLLVAHRLWDPADDGGWLIHDFEDFLPNEETREARAEAGRRGAAARWAGHKKGAESRETDGEDGKLPSACHDGDSNEVASDGSRAPAGARSHSHTQTQTQDTDQPSVDLFGESSSPATAKTSTKPAKRTPKAPHRLPEDFTVSADLAKWAREKTPAVDWISETERFKDHWDAATKNDLKRNWEAAWRTWMRNAQDRLAERGITRRWSPGSNDQGRAGSTLSRREPEPGKARSPADQRVMDNQDLYDHYRRQEQETQA